MKKLILTLALAAFLPAHSEARSPVPGKTLPGSAGAAQVAAKTPAAPSAPLTGVLSGISVPNKTVGINGKSFRMNEPLVLLIDKRANGNGLLEIADLRAGMKVRYRSSADSDGVERVVELWVQADAASAGARPRMGT